jgi:hypothetical protein
MADLYDMMAEFAYLQEDLEQQQATQRAHEQEAEADQDTREDRARRSGAGRSGSPRTASVAFAEGNQVLHDLLGEAIVRKLARADDPDNKVNIEGKRPGKNKKEPPVIHNRWVLPSSLTKIRTSPRKDAERTEGYRDAKKQRGLFGAVPDLAAHERERAAKMKPPEGPRGRQSSVRMTKESKVSVVQRICEFPEQGLIDSAGKLFCAPCKEIIPNIKGSIKDHVQRNKHTSNLVTYIEKGGDDGEVKDLLSNHFRAHPDESGTRTSNETHLYRYRVVETFIFSGTPCERISTFRPLLERAGFSLAEVPNLRLPLIQMSRHSF